MQFARRCLYVTANLLAHYQQPGKNWQNTEECYTTYWNSQANAWVAYMNTGPRGILDKTVLTVLTVRPDRKTLLVLKETVVIV